MSRRRLDIELVRRGLVPSRTAAGRAIDDGTVSVEGRGRVKPSTPVSDGDRIVLTAPAARFVGRAGEKLDGALDAFAVSVEGRRAVDVGASIGGFTDCLLQKGAASVVAVDVGHGQLHRRLRDDERVTVVERTNIRYADPSSLGSPFEVIVADLSFISLSLVAPQLAGLGERGSDWILLVKPQFEAGRGRVGGGGVVRDPDGHAEAIDRAASALEDAGVGIVGVVRSSIVGATGNREFFVHGRAAPRTVDAGTVRVVTREEGRL